MKSNHRLSCLSKVPIFAQLSAEEKDEVHRFLLPAHYKKGEYVNHADMKSSRLMVLNRGQAKIVRTLVSGKQQIMRILEVGDYIGEAAVFTDEPAASDVVATEDCSFCKLDQAQLLELLSENPKLAMRLLADLSSRLEKAEAYAESLGLVPVDDRLMGLLVEQSDGRSEFNLPWFKKDLAAHLGVAPETLSRSLNRLEVEQKIRVSGKKITLTD